MARKFWRRDITYYDLLELVSSWMESYPHKLREIPSKLSSKIKTKDVSYLQGPYKGSGGKISLRGLGELRAYVDSKIDEIEKGREYSKWQERQIFWTKILALTAIVALIISSIALIFSVMLSKESIELSERVIDMTPSKYAFIDFSLRDYFGKTIIYPLTNINNQGYIPMGINLINTGYLNTGKISIAKREDYNFDDTFVLGQIIIQDIETQENNVSELIFHVANYSNLVGLHKISLSIYCPNCFKQDKVNNPEVVYVCVYNSTDSSSDTYLEQVKKDCGI